jgi:hypothetical protein
MLIQQGELTEAGQLKSGGIKLSRFYSVTEADTYVIQE